MKVADIMRTDVKTVDVDATVAGAIATLADVHVSALPVTARVIAPDAEVLEAAREMLIEG